MEEFCKVCSLKHQLGKAKYKCPTCFLKYCGLDCWKEHRKVECSKPAADSPTADDKMESSTTPHPFLAPTDDTVQPELLEKLKESEKLVSLLRNQELRQVIAEVDRSKNVKQAIQQAMLKDCFVEFADACLEVVEPQESLK